MRTSNQRGIALITTMLVLMLMSALLIGFTTMVVSDQRYRFIDHDRGRAFYAASGAVEKLTADLGNTFLVTVKTKGSIGPPIGLVLKRSGLASWKLSALTFP
jgi:Tfp pilus assembly protein PilX